jgi:MFS family permease
MQEPPAAPPARGWITRSVLGIVLATLFSDFSHEMATAVLPYYLLSLSLGPSALGMIEGIADFLVSLAKLAGGVAGQRLPQKKPLVLLGYLVTTAATSTLAMARGLASLVSLRTLAWAGRGFRSPLRDFLLADEVRRSHYGRAFGLERAGDMAGAVAGPLLAALLVRAGLGYPSILMWSLVPGLLAVTAILALVRERKDWAAPEPAAAGEPKPSIPREFWLLLAGVSLFGLGDFSRTFLILIAARSLGGEGRGTFFLPVLLYAGHNLVSALAAYPIGRWADRRSKVRVLIGGYVLGVAANALLAFRSGEVAWVVAVIAMSGVYIAVEEVVEKASAAQFLPREVRSLGLGILACANALGDMASSLTVGMLLQRDRPLLAFGIPAACGLLGVLWLIVVIKRIERATSYISGPA